MKRSANSETRTNFTSAKRSPKKLWSEEMLPKSVDAYRRCFFEFDPSLISSNSPYSGKPSAFFRKVSEGKERVEFDNFSDVQGPLWQLKNNGAMNDLTADLLAAGAILSNDNASESSFSSGRYSGLDGQAVFVPLLDGGVGVEVHVYEHHSTNNVSCKQLTSIRGAEAYRALLERLGFDKPVLRV